LDRVSRLEDLLHADAADESHRLAARGNPAARVKEEIFPVHYLAFTEGCIHAENVGGDTRCIIGAFPWKFEEGEACPCRIIAFLDVGPLTVEEVQHAVRRKS
jgi:kynurenine formamidase